jgi:hypothetical protein
MVAVCMCDECGLNGFPRIDVKIARRAIKPVRGDDNQLFGI